MPPLNSEVRPFLKWVGGKSQLLNEIRSILPANFNRYFEPFLGGGAVYFGLIAHEYESYLSDLNPNLIGAYTNIRDRFAEVVSETLKIEKEISNISDIGVLESFYYDKREQFRKIDPYSVKKTAILIYLNKTCFNGVYRENSRGEFNVPFGKAAIKSILDLENLKKISAKLSRAHIEKRDYETVLLNFAQSNDFIYLDPPYYPTNVSGKLSGFTSYTSKNFNIEEQLRLNALFRELDARHCKVCMSNSAVPEVQKLYADFYIKTVSAKRKINCKKDGRGNVGEYLIYNYEPTTVELGRRFSSVVG